MSDQAKTQVSTIGVPAPRQPEAERVSEDPVSVPGTAQRVVLNGDEIEFQGAGGAILEVDRFQKASIQNMKVT